jgi:hypothetical protein
MSQRRPIALALTFASAVSACGTDVSKCDEQADFAAGVSTTTTAGDVTPILAQNCALGGCHLSEPGAGNLVLDVSSGAASGWVGALVGVPAQESPSMDLVAPGDPDNSWVVHKIFGELCGAMCSPTTGCGAEMPFGTSLSTTDRATVVAWVLAGAPRE